MKGDQMGILAAYPTQRELPLSNQARFKTASTNRRLSLPPLRPGSPGLPRQRGSIFAHWASVSTKRSMPGVNHSQARMKIVNPNRPYVAWVPSGELAAVFLAFGLGGPPHEGYRHVC